MIFRSALVATVVLVFAVGCARSELGEAIDSDNDSNVPPLETTVTILPSEEVSILSAITPATIVEAGNSEIAEPEHEIVTADSSRTTSIIEPPFASLVSPTNTARQMATPELTIETAALVDAAIEACSDPFEFLCSEAIWAACIDARIYWNTVSPKTQQDWTDELRALEEVVDLLCGAVYVVERAELSAVLSAKYGKDYYLEYADGIEAIKYVDHVNIFGRFAGYTSNVYRLSGYFGGIRDIYHEGIGAIDISGGVLEVEKDWDITDLIYFKMSKTTAEKLIPLTDIVVSFARSEMYTITSKDRSVARKILKKFDLDADKNKNVFCKKSITSVLYGENDWQSEAMECFKIICSPSQNVIYRICVSEKNGEFIGEDDTDSMVAQLELFWYMIPYICANGEIYQFAYPDDSCRKFASSICDIAQNYWSRAFLGLPTSNLSAIHSSTCALKQNMEVLQFWESARKCFKAIEGVRISNNELTEYSSHCADIGDECYYRYIGFDNFNCGGLEKFYDLEVIWKRLPTICNEEKNRVINFVESNCRMEIESICNSTEDISTLLPSGLYDRYSDDIGWTLCSILYPERFSIKNLSTSSIKEISRYGSFPQTLKPAEVANELTPANLDKIDLTANICASTLITPIESDCSTALWAACYDVLSLIDISEAYDSVAKAVINYLCGAAYFAELGELSEAILLSFKGVYDSDIFDAFRGLISRKLERSLVFSSGKNGRLYINSQLANRISDDALESLTALGDSLSAFLSSYLAEGAAAAGFGGGGAVGGCCVGGVFPVVVQGEQEVGGVVAAGQRPSEEQVG